MSKIKQYVVLILSLFIVLPLLFSCNEEKQKSSNLPEESYGLDNGNDLQQNTSSQEENNYSESSELSENVSNEEEKDESSEAGLSITDIKDFKEVGLKEDDPRYLYIKAFLEKDTDTLEKICCVKKGVYDSYKTLEIGEYFVSVKNEIVYFSFDIISSGLDTLPVGEYDYEVNMILDSEVVIVPVNHLYKDSTSAQIELAHWLGISIVYQFYDYENLDSKCAEYYCKNITDYLLCRYGDMTLEKIQEYALKIFNIKDFEPKGPITYKNGVYSAGGHGGRIWAIDYIEEKEEDDITYLTVQYYADFSRTIKSHIVKYKMKNIDGIWAFLGCDITNMSAYEPALFKV